MIAFFASLGLTLVCAVKLLEASEKCGKLSLMEVGYAAYGTTGKIFAEIALYAS